MKHKFHFCRFHIQQKFTQTCILEITITIYENLDSIIENNYIQGSVEEMANFYLILTNTQGVGHQKLCIGPFYRTYTLFSLEH